MRNRSEMDDDRPPFALALESKGSRVTGRSASGRFFFGRLDPGISPLGIVARDLIRV
jgi:hypothetical protein